MSAELLELPPRWPRRLLTVAGYLALGETEFKAELVEGTIQVVPPALPRHMRASFCLTKAINAVLPSGYAALQEVGLDLELAPAHQPGTVRIPDLVVARDDAFRHVDEHGGALRASDVLLVVEISSPGTRRIDRVVKRDEYAEADIPHYWIVDLDLPISILTHHRAGEFGYADGPEVTGTFRASEPFDFQLDLSTLV